MSVLVTGAAGFVGGALSRALTALGYDVVGVDRRPPADLVADLAEPLDERVREALATAEAVFHLAARPGVRDDAPGIARARRRDNVLAAARVLAATPPGTPLVLTSSSAVYGGAAGGRASAEDDPVRPRGGYARSKAAAEALCRRRRALGGLVAVARPFTVAGEGQRPDMAVSRWLAAARAGRPLQVYGSPARTRDVTDVRDVVRALVALAERGVDETVNVGTGRPHTLGEIAAAVAAATGTDPRLVVVPAGSEEVAGTRADTARCHRLLGFVPETDLVALVARQAAADPALVA